MKQKRTLDLLARFTAHGIRQDEVGRKQVKDYRDCISTASEKDLRTFEAALDTDTRKTFLWASARLLDPDQFLDMLGFTYILRTSKEIILKETAEVEERHLKLMIDLENDRNRLDRDRAELQRLQEAFDAKAAEIEALRADAGRFAALQDLLKVIEDPTPSVDSGQDQG